MVAVELNLDSNLQNIKGSSVHLSKTLMNLISNAAEAMPNGGTIWVATINRHIASQTLVNKDRMAYHSLRRLSLIAIRKAHLA